jgi:plastocyanin
MRGVMMKNFIGIIFIGLLVGFVAVLTPDYPVQPEASAQANNQIAVANYKFEPKKLTVTEGTTVTWNNKEGVHTVRSDSDAFISKTLKPGENFSYQFIKAGTYPYHCTFHGNSGGEKMSGTIVVVKKK